MRLLLDTHVILWTLGGDRALSGEATDAVRRADQLYVGAVTLAEIGVKCALGRLSVPQDLVRVVVESGMRLLPLQPDHGLAVGARVDAVGTPETDSEGERRIRARSVAVTGTGKIEPLGMTNRDIGGGTFGYQQGGWGWPLARSTSRAQRLGCPHRGQHAGSGRGVIGGIVGRWTARGRGVH